MRGSDDEHVSVDEFLREERRAIGRLEGDIGRDVVAKLDRVLVRDLIYGDATDEAEHRVLVSLRAGLDATLDPGAPRGRRVADLRAANTRRVAGLAGDVTRRGGRILEQFWITPTIAAALDRTALLAVAGPRGRHAVGDDPHPVVDTRRRRRRLHRGGRGRRGRAAAGASFGVDGSGIRIGVLDTGVDAEHKALAGRVESQQDFTGDGVGDQHGHGTQSAGLASQHRTYRGIAPGATIVDLKMIDYYGSSDPRMALAGIQAAVEAGVDVAACP